MLLDHALSYGFITSRPHVVTHVSPTRLGLLVPFSQVELRKQDLRTGFSQVITGEFKLIGIQMETNSCRMMCS